jgi:hypothetical protein
MAAVAITSVRKGWAGDIRRNRVKFTSASATTDTLTPASVGLAQIFAVVPTGRSGTIEGTASVIAASGIDYVVSSGVLIVYIPTSTSAVSSGVYEADFYGI